MESRGLTVVYPLRIIQYVGKAGAELRLHRTRLGLTQKAMAAVLGVHWNSLARMERGEMVITEPMARLVRLLTKTYRGRSASVERILKDLASHT